MILNAFNYYEVVKLGRLSFKVWQPTILDIDSYNLEMDTSDKKLNVLSNINEHPVKLLAQIVSKKAPFLKGLISFYIKHFATWVQIHEAYSVVHGVFYGSALFESSRLDRVTSPVSDTAGGRTILGQIAGFTEHLGISLNEALNTPYPVLLLMSADKQRVLGEDDVIKRRVNAKDIIKQHE